LTTADIVIIILILVGGYKGYKDGFLMGVATLAALILGVFIAFKFTGQGMEFLQDEFNADKAFLPYLSFFLIFITIVILVTLLGKFLRRSIDKTFLGRLDEAFGSVLGAFKMLFMLSVFLWIIDSLKFDLPSHWTEDSFMYSFTAHLAPAVSGWLAQFLPFFNDIFPQF
jgi:membrane protein required for colicin V production